MKPAPNDGRMDFAPRDAQQSVDPELIQALTGMSADASLAVAQRTRRAVRDTAFQIREDRQRRRRNKGIALLVAAGFLMLLTPALWSGIDEIFAGEHISDLPTMVTLTALTLFSAVLAALLASWKKQQPER
jgi:cytochrome bd-type quinol oxidase subunit 2